MLEKPIAPTMQQVKKMLPNFKDPCAPNDKFSIHIVSIMQDNCFHGEVFQQLLKIQAALDVAVAQAPSDNKAELDGVIAGEITKLRRDYKVFTRYFGAVSILH